MSQVADSPVTSLPPVPPGMSRREYRAYVEQWKAQQAADARPEPDPTPVTPHPAPSHSAPSRTVPPHPAPVPAGVSHLVESPPSAHFADSAPDVVPGGPIHPIAGQGTHDTSAGTRYIVDVRDHVQPSAHFQFAQAPRIPQRRPSTERPDAGGQAPAPAPTGEEQVDGWVDAPAVTADGGSAFRVYTAPQGSATAPTVIPLESRRERRAQAKKTQGRRAQTKPSAARRGTSAKAHRRVAPGSSSFSTSMLPKVGMVGALGVASVVAPMMANNSTPKVTVDTAMSTVEVPLSELDARSTDVGADAGSALTGRGEVRPGRPAVVVDSAAAGPQPESPEELVKLREEAEKASRDMARPPEPLPGCDPTRIDAGTKNGRLDPDALCTLWQEQHSLRADAAVALARLNVEYTKTFGDSITLNDAYRSYARQVAMKSRRPAYAARPGTSEHGWGLAIDIGDGVSNGGARYSWLRKNAPRFGWDNPRWARRGGSGPYEPWHWEYTPPKG